MTNYPNGDSESARTKRFKRCWRFIKRAYRFVVPWLRPEWQFWLRAGELALEFARSLGDAIWIINRLRRDQLTYYDYNRILSLLEKNIKRMVSFIQPRLGPEWQLFFQTRALASEFLRSLRDTSWLINQLMRGQLTYKDHDRMLNLLQNNMQRTARFVQDNRHQ